MVKYFDTINDVFNCQVQVLCLPVSLSNVNVTGADEFSTKLSETGTCTTTTYCILLLGYYYTKTGVYYTKTGVCTKTTYCILLLVLLLLLLLLVVVVRYYYTKTGVCTTTTYCILLLGYYYYTTTRLLLH